MASLRQMHRTGPHIKVRPERRPLGGNPMMKGVVLKTLIKKPKKPNSANRKCVLVRLSNGKEAVAYVPGIGHNLQVTKSQAPIVTIQIQGFSNGCYLNSGAQYCIGESGPVARCSRSQIEMHPWCLRLTARD
jgi:ribosomal protein S12